MGQEHGVQDSAGGSTVVTLGCGIQTTPRPSGMRETSQRGARGAGCQRSLMWAEQVSVLRMLCSCRLPWEGRHDGQMRTWRLSDHGVHMRLEWGASGRFAWVAAARHWLDRVQTSRAASQEQLILECRQK